MRRKIFKIIDNLKGRSVQKHLDDMECFFENRYDLKDLLFFQNERLDNIISYAKCNVPFYKKLPKDILKLPIQNKLNIRTNLGEFISDDFKINQLK